MAGAKPGVHASQLKPVSVSQRLADGAKFLRWEDDSSIPHAVTLKVDTKGHLLYWTTASGDVDFLEICSIRDARTGKSARLPRDQKLRDTCSQFGAPLHQDSSLGERSVSIAFGADLVSLQWTNFVATTSDEAVHWTQELFAYATNTLALNPSFCDLLERAWTKLYVCRDADDRIPLKSALRLFAAHKDDRRRVEQALSACKLLSSKPDFIDGRGLTFDAFLRFYTCLCPPTDIDQICQELNPSCSRSKTPWLGIDQFTRLLNDKQRDPRLNEILYPYANEAKARELMQRYEPDAGLAGKDRMSSLGLQAFLMSSDNGLIPLDKLDISQDMGQPLAHYFINSSHNTYLAGHQLTGKSSVELYRQVLLTGCRCVELDCWDGKGADEEPIVTHGFTMCSEVSFRETMEAIADTAFKVSEFPVILSFENHCSPKQQAKMVQLIKDYLGDRILTQPLESHPLKPGVQLPSPELLKGKFLIKNKKHRVKKSAKHHRLNDALSEAPVEEDVDADAAVDSLEPPDDAADDEAEDEDPELRKLREAAASSRDDVKEEKAASSKEPVMLSEISAMVNYVEPAAFYSFEYAAKKNVSHECCSISENNATNLLKEAPEDFVNFNKRQISRIYPKGTRVDSSNYMPQLFWNSGCQLVAPNFQTMDLGLQLNLGIFNSQRRCGYLLKPEFLRRPDRRFDPFSESTVDGIVASTVSLRIISGAFLSERRVSTYAEVEMYGLPADTVRKRFRTRVVPGNGLNPSYSQEPFVFKKVVLPQLATIRITVSEESGRLIGQRFLPVDSLRPGYRHVPLFTELMQPLSMATLFVCITVNDYVSDVFAEFAAALANPIQYLSEMDKHQQQLMVLTDDFEVEERQQPQQPPQPITQKSRRAARLHSDETAQVDAADSESADSARQPQQRSPRQQRLLRTATVGPRGAPSASSSGSVQSPMLPVQLSQQHDEAGAAASAAGGGGRSGGDTSCVQKLTMENIKQDKKCQKVAQKCEREFTALLKHNQKNLVSLRTRHRVAIAKYEADNSKKKLTSQSMRLHASQEEVRDEAARSASEKEFGRRSSPMAGAHEAEVREQLESQARAECELAMAHKALQRDELHRALSSAAALAEKSLHSLYSHEHAVLKKTQEKQRNSESRQLAKQFKDKTELREARREFQQKQVAAAVNELQSLDALHRRRVKELRDHDEQLRLEIDRSFDEEMRKLDEEQLSRLVDISKSAASSSNRTDMV